MNNFTLTAPDVARGINVMFTSEIHGCTEPEEAGYNLKNALLDMLCPEFTTVTVSYVGVAIHCNNASSPIENCTSVLNQVFSFIQKHRNGTVEKFQLSYEAIVSGTPVVLDGKSSLLDKGNFLV